MLLQSGGKESNKEKGTPIMILLRRERQRLGLSQSEIARRTGTMHPMSVYQLEHDKRKPGFKQRYLIEKVMREAGWDGEGDLFEEVEE